MDPESSIQRRRWLEYLIIALATLAVWGHSYQFQFAWDDRPFITDNESIRSWQQLSAMLFSRDAQSSLPDKFPLYRPVRTIAYAFFHQIGGGPTPKPGVYHIANLIGHAIAAMLVCGVSSSLLRRFGEVPAHKARIAGLLIGLAFTVHPIASEVVCWAKSFDDILAAIFCLGAASLLLAWREGHHARLCAALGFFVLAVYSKESAVSFPLIALGYFWILLRLPLARSAKLSSGFFVAAAAFVVHRHLVLGQTSQTAPISGTYWQSLIDTIPCALTYVRLGFGIPPFTIIYIDIERGASFLSPKVAGGALLLLAVATATIITLTSERWKLLGFGLLWAAAFFLPVSNIIPMMQFMAERFLYLPLVGLLLAAGVLLLQLRRDTIAAIAGCMVIALWSVVAWERSWIWRDDLTLYVETAMNNPSHQGMEENAVVSILNLVSVKRVTGEAKDEPPTAADIQNVLQALRKARIAFPRNAALANSLGLALNTAGESGKAAESFRDAVQAEPTNVLYGRNLALTLIQANRPVDAERALRKLLTLHQKDALLVRMLCQALIAQQRIEEAIPYINRLKELDPQSTEFDRWLVNEGEGKQTTHPKSGR